MTNTLHRFSDHYAREPAAEPRPVTDDYVVFAMAAKGLNDDDLVGKYRAFLELALKHDPVNIGDATHGGWLRPEGHLDPRSHWGRKHRPDPETVLRGIDGPSTVAAVFDSYEKLRAFVEALARADLGVSINIAAPMDAAHRCCREAGLRRHSVEYSIGFSGRSERLPDARTLELSTMCGHGMVSAAFARKMLDWVRENRRTPAEAAAYLARFCSCGVFNTSRAERLLAAGRPEDRSAGDG
ncbi:MAG TPA: hypothetical protein VLS93_08285 [Anaeromyxobacteraceae bacterium]|nr:hypothetical protein [Anaeromyxobacteraceae bacterium]